MATVPAAKVTKVPPSLFSVLLRRSKFASYDPQIGQIYTTYDGSAARGDWGLKRPLSVRRRDGRLAISNVDTLYQQTEWTSAYSDTTAIRKLGELAITPRLHKDGKWGKRLGIVSSEHRPPGAWLFDSDYIPSPPEKLETDLQNLVPMPNPRAMNPRRLERYVRKLRRLHPEFNEYVKASYLSKIPDVEPPSVYNLEKIERDRKCNSFLSDKFHQACKAENSTVIMPMPHPTAGLSYAYMNDLQRAVTARSPVPGRRLHGPNKDKDKDKDKRDNRPVIVAVAGWTGREVKGGNDMNATFVDWGTKLGGPRKDADAGKSAFKPAPDDCTLLDAPEVVGKYPQRIDAAEFQMQFVRCSSRSNSSRENPYVPGTAGHIAYNPQRNTHAPNVNYNGRKVPKGMFRSVQVPPREPVYPRELGQPVGLIRMLKEQISSVEEKESTSS